MIRNKDAVLESRGSLYNLVTDKRPDWCCYCGVSSPDKWFPIRNYKLGLHNKCRESYKKKMLNLGFTDVKNFRLGFLPYLMSPRQG